MALPLFLAIGDVGCEVAALLSLHDLCRMHVSSHGLQRETKVLVARSEASQRRAVCDLTPFPTKKALTDFLAKGPTWLNDFIPHVRLKLQRFESDHETHLRRLHAHIAVLNKTARQQGAWAGPPWPRAARGLARRSGCSRRCRASRSSRSPVTSRVPPEERAEEPASGGGLGRAAHGRPGRDARRRCVRAARCEGACAA